MRKTCLIKQPAGMGDIFFCLKIAKKIQQETDYKRILWPIAKTHLYIRDYLIADGIEFCDETLDFDYKDIYLSGHLYFYKTENLLYVPLESCNHVLKKCSCHNNPLACCHMKYNFCNMTFDDWMDYFDFKRNVEREEKFVELLGIDLSEPFNIVNRHLGTYPNYSVRRDIEPGNGLKNIFMDFYQGVTIFDWLKILECAREVHSVSTCLSFFLHKLGLQNVSIYCRIPGINGDYPEVKGLFNKNWNYYY